MVFVLDASITLAWCFQDEATESTQIILEKAKTESIYVPSVWPLEVGNILLGAEKKKRIAYADIMQFVDLIGQLQIEIDEQTSQRALSEILSLAHAENLTTYDAAYLELAMRKGAPLATKDQQLKRAAQQLEVEVW